jgi:hypothetical protein
MIQHNYYPDGGPPVRNSHPSDQICPECSPYRVAKVRSRTRDQGTVARVSDPDSDHRKVTRDSDHTKGRSSGSTVRGNPGFNAPMTISRMSERSVYDLDRIRANPFNVGATNADLVSRALHGGRRLRRTSCRLGRGGGNGQHLNNPDNTARGMTAMGSLAGPGPELGSS